MTPKISVIVPVYNAGLYLAECLDSILSQTLSETEVIVINDGSSDNSGDIISEYAKSDSRIIVINKENEGAGKARNDGLDRASGEFIAFMDADDYYPSGNVLEILYRCATENNVPVAGGRKSTLGSDGKTIIEAASFEEHGIPFHSAGMMNYSDFQYDYGYTAYIYRRGLINENGFRFPDYRRFQDPPFFVRAMSAASVFCMADIESYCYRMVEEERKTSLNSTLGFFRGVSDNLVFSRENNLAKLHYLSAMRLDAEGSYMVTCNIYNEGYEKLISEMISAIGKVDAVWLREQGFALRDPFIPSVFDYLVSTAGKYEKLRRTAPVKLVGKIIHR